MLHRELGEERRAHRAALSGFAGERAAREHSFLLPMAPQDAIALFTPEGERAWAEDWDPAYVYPAAGTAVEGMVFTTAAAGEETLWLLTKYEPAQGRAEYARITPGSRVAMVKVRCEEEGAQTRVTVSYTITGLSAAGNAYARDMTARRFADYIETWPASIAKARAEE
jgi:hypothetical protein